MAYSTSNPPVLMVSAVGGGPRIWFHTNTDATTAVRVAGYYTNGYALGMRKNDLLLYVDTDAAPITMHLFIVNEATTTTVDLSDGTAITSADTD